MDGLLVVARFQALFGIQGWLKVYSYTRPPSNIAQYSPWFVKHDTGVMRIDPVQVKAHGKTLVAQIAGFTDRESAAALLGREIAIERQQLPSLDADAYYWSELVGLKVLTPEGLELGTVAELMETGSADVLVVRGAGGEHLIPFVQGVYVLAVALESGTMTVNWHPDY